MVETKKLLILGGSGFVGARTAQQAIKAGWEVTCTYNQRLIELEGCHMWPLDLSAEGEQLAEIIAKVKPDVIINSSVPNIGVGASPDEHFKVSVGGIEKLLAILQQNGQSPRILQVSTNAVFDGRKGMYTEQEETAAATRADAFSAYGVSKAQGEQTLLKNWQNAVVVRTALVWGRDYAGQLNRRTQNEIVTPLQEGRTFRRFSDRYITPTLVDSVADALIELLEMPFRGIIHVAGRERLSDVELATKIARWLRLDESLIEPESRPPTMPGDITLAVDLAQSLLKTSMLTVDEQLAIVYPV